MRLLTEVFVALLAIVLTGCGGSNMGVASGPPPTVSITSSATTATVTAGASQTFVVVVSGTSNTAVAWSIQEGAAGGTIDANGKYTAPSTQGIYHIVATSMADPTKSVTITVTALAAQQVSIAISPASIGPMPQASIFQFVANFAGTLNTGASWSVVEGSAGGTVDTSGRYTAPNTSGTFHVKAVSAADPTKSATATITVGGPAIVVTVSCPLCFPKSNLSPSNTLSLFIAPGRQQQFTATVTGTNNTAVTWSVGPQNGGQVSGTIDANGLFTAGATPASLFIVAQSVADPKISDLAEIYVTTDSSSPSSVNTSPSTTNILAGATQPFRSTVEYYAPSVTYPSKSTIWSVQEGPGGGTIDANGVYTAPPVLGTFHVVMSMPNLSLTATSTVNVIGFQTGFFSASKPSGSWIVPVHGATVSELSDGSILSAGGYYSLSLPTHIADSSTNVAGHFYLDSLGNVVAEQVGNLNQARGGAAAARLQDGRILIVGGAVTDTSAVSPFLASAEIYDPITKSFTATGSMSVVRMRGVIRAVTLQDGRVLVFGPEMVSSNPPFPTSAEVYDPRTGAFGARIPISPDYQVPATALLRDGRVLLAGAGGNGNGATTSAVLFDPKTQTFTPTGSMSASHSGATATVLADGTVLVADGYNPAEIYDPKTGTFSPAGQMLPATGIAFPDGSSILLPSGKVLLVGGAINLFYDGRITQLYDPETRSFKYAAESTVGHHGSSVFLMPNGTVLVTDGMSDTFEFYHP